MAVLCSGQSWIEGKIHLGQIHLKEVYSRILMAEFHALKRKEHVFCLLEEQVLHLSIILNKIC